MGKKVKKVMPVICRNSELEIVSPKTTKYRDIMAKDDRDIDIV